MKLKTASRQPLMVLLISLLITFYSLAFPFISAIFFSSHPLPHPSTHWTNTKLKTNPETLHPYKVRTTVGLALVFTSGRLLFLVPNKKERGLIDVLDVRPMCLGD